MDEETGKVLLAAIGGLGLTITILDWILRTAIAVLTLWYLWIRIRRNRSGATRAERIEEEDEI